MKSAIHKAGSRGYFDHGWLRTNHSFSFSGYYDPERMGFGKLRVLNDDIVLAGYGFGKHGHENMEIITVPLTGELKHGDSTGKSGIIRPGDIQVMTAGSGIQHYEKNPSKSADGNFLQLWIFPRKNGLEPRYDQKSFNPEERKNDFQLIVSPDGTDGSLMIHQDAWLNLIEPREVEKQVYQLKDQGNGVYIFVIEGSVNIEGQKLAKRDGAGFWQTDKLDIEPESDAFLLLIEVPM